MNLKIVTWNARGLNDGSKRLRVRNLIKRWRVDLVCFQETKLNVVSRGLIGSLWGGRHVDWLFVGSQGASGGILLIWDKRYMQRVDEALGNFSVSCKFRMVSTGVEWAFSGVYGPHNSADRGLLWEELSGVHGWWEVPWVVGGDFNVVRYPSERLGAVQLTSGMQGFSDFIFAKDLIDIPMLGGQYTWSNTHSKSRLDRFLFTSTVENLFSNIAQRRLPRLLSDHSPILLECGTFHRGKTPFRLENMWLQAEGFVNKVRSWWDSYDFHGSPSFVLTCKLKALKLDLKKWNKEEFGSVVERINSLVDSIKVLEEVEESRALSGAERSLKEKAVEELEKLCCLKKSAGGRNLILCGCEKVIRILASSIVLQIPIDVIILLRGLQ